MRRPSFAVATLGVVTFRLVNALVPVRVPAKKHVIRAGIRRRSTTTTCGLGSVTDGVDVASKIYQLAGREFDIGKPSILAKVGDLLRTELFPRDFCLSYVLPVLNGLHHAKMSSSVLPCFRVHPEKRCPRVVYHIYQILPCEC